MWRAFCLVAALLLSQQPAFKTGVDLITVDVHVVDRNGRPVLDLTPSDFDVLIGGDRRQVTNLQLVTYGSASAVMEAATRERSLAPTPDAAPRPRRMFVLAIDEHSLHAANALAAINAAERFVDKLQPDDLVGVYAYPTGVAQHDLTTDHAAARSTLRKAAGLFEEPIGQFNLSPSEAIDIAENDREALMRVLRRACPGNSCRQEDILAEARSFVTFLEMRVTQSVGGLRGLVRGLGAIPGRKILVVVSGGLVSTDRVTGRVQAGSEVAQLGREAAQANVAVFALHLDWSFLQALSSRGGLRTSYFRDSNMAATGLELMAGYAGGAVMRVHGTSPDQAFDRVLNETSAHYLLGVEGRDSDRVGNPKTIRVAVKRRGTEVRARTLVVVPRK